MKIISDNISDDNIYNQVIELTKEFIEEQLQSNNIKNYSKKITEHYLNLLRKIRKDKGNSSKLFYIMYDNKVIGLEIALTYYSKRDNAVIGNKACIYIKEEYRGQRIEGKHFAVALDQLIEEYFKQKKVAIQKIITLAGNERQINVYRYVGYKVVARRGANVYLEKANL